MRARKGEGRVGGGTWCCLATMGTPASCINKTLPCNSYILSDSAIHGGYIPGKCHDSESTNSVALFHWKKGNRFPVVHDSWGKIKKNPVKNCQKSKIRLQKNNLQKCEKTANTVHPQNVKKTINMPSKKHEYTHKKKMKKTSKYPKHRAADVEAGHIL